MMAASTVSTQSPARSLKGQVAYALAGNTLYTLCQWGLLIALTKLGTPTDVGHYSLALAVAAPVFMLSSLQLRSLLATDARGDFRFGDYLALRLASDLFAVAIVVGVALLGPYEGEAALAICLVALAKALEAWGDIYQGFAQSRERMDLVGRALLAKGLLALLGMVAGLAATGRLLTGLAGLAAAWALGLVCFDLRYARRLARTMAADSPGGEAGLLRPRWSRANLRALAILGLPLGLASMLGSLTLNLPRLVVASHLGMEALGIYSALAYLMVGGQLIGSSVTLGLSTRLAAQFVSDRRAYRRLLSRALALCSAVGILGLAVALVWGRPLLRILYTPQYAEHQGLFVAVMVATLLNTVFWPVGVALTIARRTRAQLWLRLAAAALGWAGTLYLLPRFGLIGAAGALCLAFAVQLAAGLAAIRSQFTLGTAVPAPRPAP